jgi:hypothetical protein
MSLVEKPDVAAMSDLGTVLQWKDQFDETVVFTTKNGGKIAVGPDIDSDSNYWSHRVEVEPDRYVVAFPAFGQTRIAWDKPVHTLLYGIPARHHEDLILKTLQPDQGGIPDEVMLSAIRLIQKDIAQ